MTIDRFPDYQVAGDSDTTIYLLHGAYGSKDYFQNEISVLVHEGFRVVAWDAPGYGISPLPVGGFTIEKLAAAAARLIDRTHSKTNIVMGHSMGGITAPLVAQLASRHIHGLVISATGASFSRKPEADKITFLAERINPLNQGIPFREAAMPVILSMFAPGSNGPLVDRVIEFAAGMKCETFRSSIEAIVHYDGIDTLKSVNVPTLLIAGESDKVGRPEMMQGLLELIPSAKFVCIPGAGHYAFAEQPEAFNKALIEFVRKVEFARNGV